MKRILSISIAVLCMSFANSVWAHSQSEPALDRLQLFKASSSVGMTDLDLKRPEGVSNQESPVRPARAIVPATDNTDRVTRLRIDDSFNKMPLRFEKNEGQTSEEVKFLSRGQGYTMFLTPTESVMALTKVIAPETPRDRLDPRRDREPPKMDTAVVRMEVVEANPDAKIVGKDKLPGTSNYFLGNDRSKWRQAVPNYGKVHYEEVYPGIDLVYYGNQRKLEYDFIVKPGADPNQIALKFSGNEDLSVNDKGDLVLKTRTGDVIQHAPIIYQTIDGQRKPVSGSYHIESKNRVTFQLAQYDTGHDLVIDPVLGFSTYFGDSSYHGGAHITVDNSGNIYMTGHTSSSDFDLLNPIKEKSDGPPLPPPWIDPPGPDAYLDVFVSKFEQTGNVPSLAYSTFMGGMGGEKAYSITVDDFGNVYVTGSTGSEDFYPADFPEPSCFGGFVFKIEDTNNIPFLSFATCLPSGGGREIALDGQGNIYVGGISGSDLETLNPVEGTSCGGIFVAKWEKVGETYNLAFSTCMFRGDIYGMDVDSSGNIYVTGQVSSSTFPTINEIEGFNNGGHYDRDAIVFKLEQTNNIPSIGFSTYLGGTSTDRGDGIKVNDSGDIYVSGNTSSLDFETLNSIEEHNGGKQSSALYNYSDLFVVKLHETNNVPSLVYSTLIGGNFWDLATDIEMDDLGNIYVTGDTHSSNFDMVNEISENPLLNNKDSDFFKVESIFVIKLTEKNNIPFLDFSTYFGSSGGSRGKGVKVDNAGNIYISGFTYGDFEYLNEIEDDIPGDFIIMKINPSKLPVLNDFDANGTSDVLTLESVDGDIGTTLLDNSIIQSSGDILQINSAAGWTVNASGDFNGDGKSDLLLHNNTTGEIMAARVDGTSLIDGAVVHTLNLASGLAPHGVGDFDGDKNSEVILYDPATGDLSLIFLNGDAVSSIDPVGQIDVGNDWVLQGTGDFDQDNKTDFLIFNTVTGAVSVMEMNGATISKTTEMFILDPAKGWSIETTGDFDGDQDTDLLARHTSGAIAVVELHGQKAISSYDLGTLPAGWEIINAGMYDADKKADLLAFDSTTGDLLTIIQDGTETTAINTVTNIGTAPSSTIHPGYPQ